jgi:hypothetical protein
MSNAHAARSLLISKAFARRALPIACTPGKSPACVVEARVERVS